MLDRSLVCSAGIGGVFRWSRATDASGGFPCRVDGFLDEVTPVGGIVADHLPFLKDGRTNAPGWPTGLFLLGDDHQERGLQSVGVGVEDGQAIENALSHDFAGKVGLLISGSRAWRGTPGREQDTGKVARPHR